MPLPFGVESLNIGLQKASLSNVILRYAFAPRPFVDWGTYTPTRAGSRREYKPDGSYRVIHRVSRQDKEFQRLLIKVITADNRFPFSEYCYCRTGKGQHKAIARARKLAKRGNIYLLKVDISRFYASISHRILYKILKSTGRIDEQLLEILLNQALIHPPYKGCGIPEGFPISSWLANTYLGRLDSFLVAQNYKFVRHVDDVYLFFRSEEKAKQALKRIKPFVEANLKLEVNANKTYIGEVWGQNILGYSLKPVKDTVGVRIHTDNEDRFKARVHYLIENRLLQGHPELFLKELNQYINSFIPNFSKVSSAVYIKRLDNWLLREIMSYLPCQYRTLDSMKEVLRVLIGERAAKKFASMSLSASPEVRAAMIRHEDFTAEIQVVSLLKKLAKKKLGGTFKILATDGKVAQIPAATNATTRSRSVSL